ncbi:MAG: hypothetical protein ACOX6A_10375 [Atribacter sp.]|nr:hypothetical protein [Atribacterota bacterium]
MTNWVVEIATSLNQRTVGLLAITDLDRYFLSSSGAEKQHEGLS